jgi:hypothetical protein
MIDAKGSVIPAKAGIQWFYVTCLWGGLAAQGFFFGWIPAFAGMTL